MNCYTCKTVPVSEEFERCPACATAHQELCANLNAKIRPHDKPPKEVLIPFKKIQQGIEITTYYSKEECRIWGLKIPEEYA